MLHRFLVQASLAVILFAVFVDPAHAACGTGYTEMDGDIPRWGSINGRGMVRQFKPVRTVAPCATTSLYASHSNVLPRN
eukprot:473368-Rhodomonas_salina.5